MLPATRIDGNVCFPTCRHYLTRIHYIFYPQEHDQAVNIVNMECIEGIEVIVGTYEELTLGYRIGKDSEENNVVFVLCINSVYIVY